MPFDQKLWDTNACGCRCLLELYSRHFKTQIRPEDIYKTYEPLSRGVWNTKPGLTDEILLLKIAKDLGLANSAMTYVDHEKLIVELPYAVGILGYTERQINSIGPTTPHYHVMLVWPEKAGFKYWSPMANGKVDEDFLPWQDWTDMMMRGRVLYP